MVPVFAGNDQQGHYEDQKKNDRIAEIKSTSLKKPG
jgi:hypothetical protein